jgi:arylsulfatase A-like enzyme
VVPDLCLNGDLAPTIAELAGLTPPAFVDGRSLAPLLRGEQPTTSRTVFLVELFAASRRAARRSDPNQSDEGIQAEAVLPYRALRTHEALYVEYDSGERELYDLRRDPYELQNLVTAADSALVKSLSTRLAELAGCGGARCQAVENAPLDGLGVP